MKGAPAAYAAPDSPSAYRFGPRTPVVSVGTNSYNLSTAHASLSPPGPPSSTWTRDEHLRFLHALEQYGAQQHQQQSQSDEHAAAADSLAAWQAIAQSVRTRTLDDVKAHASWYLLELQLVNVQRRDEQLLLQALDARWTREEDALFEHLLAVHAESAMGGFAWELIAAKLPDKSVRDVQERYHKLCYDIARIEAGRHVTMSLSSRRFVRAKEPTAGPELPDPHSVRAGDCGVGTLTDEEAARLVDALQLVSLSVSVSSSSAPMHAAVASAVATLTNAYTKGPPERTTALFTLDEARAVFDDLLRQPQASGENQDVREPSQCLVVDQRAVLDVIVRRLRLLPPVDHTSSVVGQQLTPLPLRPLATAGFAFGDTPSYSTVHFVGGRDKGDASQRGAVAEDLLSFRKQPPLMSQTGPSSFPTRSRDAQSLFTPASGSSFAYAYPAPLVLPSPSPSAFSMSSHGPLSAGAEPSSSRSRNVVVATTAGPNDADGGAEERRQAELSSSSSSHFQSDVT